MVCSFFTGFALREAHNLIIKREALCEPVLVDVVHRNVIPMSDKEEDRLEQVGLKELEVISYSSMHNRRLFEIIGVTSGPLEHRVLTNAILPVQCALHDNERVFVVLRLSLIIMLDTRVFSFRYLLLRGLCLHQIELFEVCIDVDVPCPAFFL